MLIFRKDLLQKLLNRQLLVAKQLKEKFGSEFFVVKAQIHAGGRGKGGGVKLAKSVEEAGVD